MSGNEPGKESFMGKKTAGGLLGTIIVTGVAVGIARYLKDYAGVKFADEGQITKVKNDSDAVRKAVKRTYIAIREKTDVKEAATELTKAAGSVMGDAADIAKTAGSETVSAFKDIRDRYEEDPEAVRAEIGENISDMTQSIAKSAQDKTAEFIDKIKSAYAEEDIDTDELEDVPECCTAEAYARETVDDAEGDDVSSDASEAEEPAAAADAETQGAEPSEEAGSVSDDEAGSAAESAAETITEAADALKTATEDTAETAADIAAKAGAGAADTVSRAADTAESAVGSAAAMAEKAFAHPIDDGSFRLNYIDDDDDSQNKTTDNSSNVTITDDKE